MKHIIKVASLSNLPETRPLVAMDNNGNLGWRSEEPIPPEPTLLTVIIDGTKDSGYGEDIIIQYTEGMTWS